MSAVSSEAVIACWPVRSLLGEGLHWDSLRGVLWHVDIRGQRVLRTDVDSGETRSCDVPERCGWVLPAAASERLLLGLAGGPAVVELGATGLPCGEPRRLASPFADPALRLNDAKADSAGNVWAGSMHDGDARRADGCLYRLASDGLMTVVDTGYCVANGPAICPDETTLLHTDSALRTIYAFDLFADEGRIANKRLWLKLSEHEGFPDGMCFDLEGCVWMAHWGGACITRRDPTGRLIRRIDLPVPLVSNVCFGGPRLDRLFVSSARDGLSLAELELYSKSGSVFEVDPGAVRGIPVFGWNDINN